MSKIISIVILVTGIFLSISTWAQNNSVQPMVPIQHWNTSKGVPVYFVKIPNLPMVDVVLAFAAGSAYDGPNFGLASVVASMVGESTTQKTADQIADSFDDLGAQFDAQAERNMATISLRSLSDAPHLNPTLDNFYATLKQINFPAEVLARIKNQTASQIESDKDDTRATTNKIFFQSVYQNHPYAHPINGTLNTLKNISPAMVQDFYQRFYVNKNLKIVMVGDLTREQAERIAEQTSQVFPDGEPAPTLPLAEKNEQAKIIKVPMNSTQSTIMMGQVGIQPNNPDYFPLLLGNSILGDQRSMTTILFREIREKRGLAYFAYSILAPLPYRGIFAMSLQTKASQAPQALQLLQEIIKNYVAKGPTADEISLTKQFLLGNFPLSINSNKDIAQAVTNMVFYNYPLDFLDRYQSNLSRVTNQQINDAFKKTINPDKLVAVVTGPQ